MKKPDDIKFALECGCGIPMPCNSCPYKNAADHNCGAESSADALDYIEQLEAKVPRWINVEERLPPEGQPVIVFATHTDRWSGHWHAVMEDCWFGGGWDVNCDTDIHKVTHWMPLPEPPVEV